MARKVSQELMAALEQECVPRDQNEDLATAIRSEIQAVKQPDQLNRDLLAMMDHSIRSLYNIGVDRVLAIQVVMILDDGSVMSSSTTLGVEI